VELRISAWMAAILSAGIAAVPVPGLSICADLAILTFEGASYYSQLGLDEQSLKCRAMMLSMDAEPLFEIVRRDFPNEFSSNVIKAIAVQSVHIIAMGAAGMVVEEVARFIPVIGSLIAAPISLVATRCILACILDKMEKTALEVVNFVDPPSSTVDDKD